jgi:hypothetical protein
MSKATKHGELLAVLAAGPVRRYLLLNGRQGIFRLAYQELLREGLIVESESSPVYVGLPGVSFPATRYRGGVRPADLALLVRSGLSEAAGRDALQEAINSPGDNTAAVMAILSAAHQRIQDGGGEWADAIPMPHDKREPGRPKKGEPFFNPLMPNPERDLDKGLFYDDGNPEPLEN